MTTPIDIMKPLYKWKPVRWEKCLALYELASYCNNAIVELGSYNGNGTIALALGAKRPYQVYGIDQYKRSSGIYHQEFYASDEQDLHSNAAKCNVQINTVKADAVQAAKNWDNGPVSLVVWDISLPNRMPDDFLAWTEHIEPGGLYLMKDNHKWELGWRDLVNALPNNWKIDYMKYEACLWGVRKLG